MIKNSLALFFHLLTGVMFIHAQKIDTSYIKEHAVKIDSLAGINDRLYNCLGSYHLIMIGEMHGINETPEFLLGLVRTFTAHNRRVIAGFEVPRDLLPQLSHLSYHQVAGTAFFRNCLSGRENKTMARVISQISNMNGASVLPYDLPTKDSGSANWFRDSTMFIAINNALKQDTSAVVITLSGNLHNNMERAESMGWYLTHDAHSAIKKERVYSIFNLYESGYMLNNIGGGARINKAYDNAGIFGKLFNFDKYLIDCSRSSGYSGYLFTRVITPVEPCK